MWGAGGSKPAPKAGALASARKALDALRLALRLPREQCDDPLERLELYLLTLIDILEGVAVDTSSDGLEQPVGHPTAHNLRIQSKPDGSGVVSIDAKASFHLSAGLKELLEFLAADGSSGEDSLVPWKSRMVVQMWLQKTRGREFTRGYVNKRIGDLRDRLEAEGFSREYVQSHPVKGVRFALRRGGPTSPEPSATRPR